VESLEGIKVLVVDDHEDITTLLAEVLRHRRATVATAASGQEAVALFARFQPDVIVSDIGTPDGDGYQLLRMVRTRSREHGGQTPAIALTAKVALSDQTRAKLAGFSVHLAKPVEPDRLCAAIRQLFTDHKR
jgi:CheY-like chemotaxis protein